MLFYQLLHDTIVVIPIVESNNRVTIPTVVHAQDHDRCCGTLQY